MRSHWVRGSPAPPAPLPRCGPCGGLHVCLRNTLGGTGLEPVPTNAMKDSRRPLLPSLTQPAGLKPVPTNAVKDRAAGRPHPQPAPALRALRWPPRLSQKYARRDGVATRPYQRDERQSCGPPAPPAPLPRCGRGGIVNAVSLKDVGAGSPLLSTLSKSRVSDHSLTYLLLTVALPELG